MEVKKTVLTTLVLEEKEASWLKNLVQNPIGYAYADEPQQEKDMRKKFWNALSNGPQAIVWKNIV